MIHACEYGLVGFATPARLSADRSNSPTNLERRSEKEDVGALAVSFPNLVGLLIGLLRDERVSQADRPYSQA